MIRAKLLATTSSLCLILGLGLLPQSARATTYTVTSATDDGTGTVSGTLSYEIAQANMAGGTNTVNFASGITTVTLSGNLPAITDSGLTITGTVNASSVTIAGGGNTIFSNSATATLTGLNLTGGTTDIAAGANNVTLDAVSAANPISGSAGITVGTGTSVLSGTNTYTGGTTIAGFATTATLSISSDANLGATGTGNGITFGGFLTTDTLRTTEGVTSARTISVGSSSFDIIDTDGNTDIFSGVISGSDGLAVNDSSIGRTGILTLSGINTYTGSTTLEAGTLAVSSDSNLGSTSGTPGAIIFDGGTLRTTAGVTSARAVTMTAAGTIDSYGEADTFSGLVSGSGALTVTDGSGNHTGVVTLSDASNSYTGGTIVTGGATVAVAADADLGNTSGGLTFNNGGLRTTTGFTSARTIALTGAGTIDSYGQADTFSGVVSGAGGLTIGDSTNSGTGHVTLSSGANNYTGGTTISGNATLSVNSDAELGNTSGGITLNNGELQLTSANISSARTISLGSGGGTVDNDGYGGDTLSGVISGSGHLTILDSGQDDDSTTLTGTNTYTGGTTVNGADLVVSTDANLGAASGSLTLTNEAELETTANLTTARAITLSNLYNEIETDGYTDTFSGVISGTGNLEVEDGKAILTGVNTYTGGTRLYGSTLAINSDAALGAAGTSIRLYSTSTLQTIANVSSNRPIALSGANSIDSDGFTDSFSGLVSNGSLTITDSSGTNKGVVTLSDASNSYSSTTVTGGATVAVSADGDLGTSTGGVTFNSGTLRTTAGLTSARTIALTGAGTLDAYGQTDTFSGVVSGAGLLTVASSSGNAGTVTLSGTNTYTGGTKITSNATLAVAADANLGNTSGGLTLDGGTLQTTSGFTSARAVALTANNGTVNTAGVADTLSGVISGAGGLSKTGAGTLTLTGLNTYTGATNVNAGTLALSGAGSLSSNTAVTVASLATFTIVAASGNETIGSLAGSGTVLLGTNQLITGNTTSGTGTSTTYTGTITGTGGFDKTDNSTQTLDGTETITGTTTVGGGTLEIGDASSPNATYTATAVNVSAAGTLRGHGTINSNVTNSGIVAPGGTIGTLTINGNYTQGSAGTLAIELNPTTTSKLVVNGGSATLGGTLTITPDAGRYTTGTVYQILTASNGVSGTFATVTDANPSLATFTAVYGANYVDLNAMAGTTNVVPSGVTQTRDQQNLAYTLNALSPTTTSGSFNTTLNDVAAITSPSAQRAALNELSSPVGADLQYSGNSNMRLVMSSVESRLSGAPDTLVVPLGQVANNIYYPGVKVADASGDFWPTLPPMPDFDIPAGLSAWVQGFGEFSSVGGSNSGPGFSSTVGGGAVGVEMPLDKDSKVGLLFGAADNQLGVNNVPQSADQDTYVLGVYGSHIVHGGDDFDRIVLDGTLAIGYSHATTQRQVLVTGATANGSTDGDGVGLQLGAGYPINFDDDTFFKGTTLTPHVGLNYTYSEVDGYTESGAPGANLSVNGNDQSLLQTSVGATVAHKFALPSWLGTGEFVDTISPEAHVGWLHEVLNPRGQTNASFAGIGSSGFTTYGATPDRDAAAVGFGFSFSPKEEPAMNIYTRYDAVLSSDQTDQQITAGLKFSW